MKTMKIFNLMIFKINNQTKQNNIPTRVDLWSKCGANQRSSSLLLQNQSSKGYYFV